MEPGSPSEGDAIRSYPMNLGPVHPMWVEHHAYLIRRSPVQKAKDWTASASPTRSDVASLHNAVRPRFDVFSELRLNLDECVIRISDGHLTAAAYDGKLGTAVEP